MSDPAITLIYEYDESEITAASLRATSLAWLRARSKPVDHFGRALGVAASVPKSESGLFSADDSVGAPRQGSK